MQCPQCGKPATGDVCAACEAALTEETPKWYAEGIAHLTEEKQYGLAQQLLSEGLQRYPDAVILWYNGGVLAEITGHAQAAVKYYKKCLKLNPNASSPRKALERLLGRPLTPPTVAQDPPSVIEAEVTAPPQYEESATPVVDVALEVADVPEVLVIDEPPIQDMALVETPAEALVMEAADETPVMEIAVEPEPPLPDPIDVPESDFFPPEPEEIAPEPEDIDEEPIIVPEEMAIPESKPAEPEVDEYEMPVLDSPPAPEPLIPAMSKREFTAGQWRMISTVSGLLAIITGVLLVVFLFGGERYVTAFLIDIPLLTASLTLRFVGQSLAGSVSSGRR